MRGVFVDGEANDGWFWLKFDAAMDAGGGGRELWILRAIAHFKGSQRSLGLFEDFEDSYIKV